MPDIVARFSWLVKEKMRQRFRSCVNALVRLRYLIVFNLWHGRRVREIESVLGVHNTTIYRVAKRFREHGEASLWDGRENNGAEKLSENYLGILDQVVRSSPHDHGWRRPTWTRELLVKTMVLKTGVRIHVATMSRAFSQAEHTPCCKSRRNNGPQDRSQARRSRPRAAHTRTHFAGRLLGSANK